MNEREKADGRAIIQSDLERCARIFQEFDPLFWSNRPNEMQFDVGPIKLPHIPLHPDIYPHFEPDPSDLNNELSTIGAVVDTATGRVTFGESILRLPDTLRQRVVSTQAAINVLTENKIRPPSETELDQCYDYFENELGGMYIWPKDQLEIQQYGLVKVILAEHKIVGDLDRDGLDLFWTNTIPRMFTIAAEYLEKCESMYVFNKMLEAGTWDIAENDPWRFFIYETLESFRVMHQNGKNWQELFAVFKTGDSHNFRDAMTDLFGDQFGAEDFTNKIYEALASDSMKGPKLESSTTLQPDFIRYDNGLVIKGTEFSVN